MNYLKNPFILYGVILILLIGNIGEVAYIIFNQKECPVCETEGIVVSAKPEVEEENTKEAEPIFVDIKGFVKKPGVYELKTGAIVNDLIKVAGGLKTGATTENINLSKKLVNEATVVVLSKYELKKKNECETNTNNTKIKNSNQVSNFAAIEESNNGNANNASNSTTINGKISINTASKEELMTLSGVGEKTAEKIIEYRSIQKFNTIEDIKNVSGIGDAVFEKIKDLITV